MKRMAPNLVLAALTAVLVGFVWWPEVFATQDGAAHLESSWLLAEWFKGDSFVQSFVELERPAPNWLSHLLLAGMLQVMEPVIAEKLLLTLCTVVPVLGFRKAVNGLALTPLAALMVLPLVHHQLFFMGFFNFCLSVGLAFWSLGSAARREHPAKLSTLLVLTWLCHPVGFALGAGAIALHALSHRRFAQLWTLVPGGVLLALFTLISGGHGLGPSQIDKAFTFKSLAILFSFNPTELTVSTLLWLSWLATGVFVVVRSPRWRTDDALGVAALGLMGLFWLSPGQAGGGAFLEERILLFAALYLGLWLGTRVDSKVFFGVAGAASLGLVGLRWDPMQQHAQGVSAYRSLASSVAPSSTFVTVHLSRTGWPGPTKVDPLLHAGGWVAIDHEAIHLSNYQLGSGHFPLRYRGERDPWGMMGSQASRETDPANLQVLAYERTGVTVDHVLVWGITTEHPVDGLHTQLSEGFVVERDIGTARLYTRRKSTVDNPMLRQE